MVGANNGALINQPTARELWRCRASQKCFFLLLLILVSYIIHHFRLSGWSKVNSIIILHDRNIMECSNPDFVGMASMIYFLYFLLTRSLHLLGGCLKCPNFTVRCCVPGLFNGTKVQRKISLIVIRS